MKVTTWISPPAELLPPAIVAGSTTRHFSAAKERDPAKIGPALAGLFGADEAPAEVVLCTQPHEAVVANVSPNPAPAFRMVPGCDGLVTAAAGVMVAVRSADCVPILLWDSEGTRVAAVHAGWRGTLAGIASEAVAALGRAGVQPARLTAWIGPCISQACYEVSPELAGDFRARHGELGDFSTGRHVNLGWLNALQLGAAGIPPDRIALCGRCTFSDPEFPSFRRDGSGRGQLYTFAVIRKGACSPP